MSNLCDYAARLQRLRERRLAEDERLVCMERARILQATRQKYVGLSRCARQAAVLRELCERITPVIEPEDLIVGRMPEVAPTPEQERFIAEHPELFLEPGVPGWLNSMSIYVPEWDRLVDKGLGGIAAEIRCRLRSLKPGDEDSREFLEAAIQALEAVSLLIRRYADEARRCAAPEVSSARRAELEEIAERCERVAWEAPASFVDALQLIQIVHMVLSCLVGGRDVTPGRVDQYLFRLYRNDVAKGCLTREAAVMLLAMFFLRLSQMGGQATDFDDNVRRSPCKYTHLYVTVGGVDREGKSAVNELSYVVADAVRILNYKEPTLLVRYRADMDRSFAVKIAELVKNCVPVTIYNDEVVIAALVRQGVPLEDARGYAHSACHNAIVPGREAGSGVGRFHNLPKVLLLAMNAGRDLASGERVGAPTPEPHEIHTFDQFWQALRTQVRFLLAGARQYWERKWKEEYQDACPLLQSCLMEFSVREGKPCWQSAPVSHLNHYLVGLGTAVDSLVAIRRLVFEEKAITLAHFVAILRADWRGHETLRQRIRTRLPRYGQDNDETCEIASRLGQMWVEEVELASRGMRRFQMWPGFYSHVVHLHQGKDTPATPDGRKAGDSLSENVAPSFGAQGCTPTSILRAMSALPFDHTPSGAASLALSPSDLARADGTQRLIALIETYFRLGGLHLQINVVDAAMLQQAMETPEHYSDLVVRVAGYSAYFVRLSRDVQQDIVERYARDVG